MKRRLLTVLAGSALLLSGVGLLSPSAGARVECTIKGTAANDRLTGTTRDDVICGRAGQDQLFGEEGNDYVLGGQGDDQLAGQNGSDRLKGGPDDELAICHGRTRQPRQCGGGKRKDLVTTGGIEGGNQNDWMSGGQGDDDLFGNDGNDTLKTRDHVNANDEADGGPATDTCVIDAGDTANNCEQ
jgi:Ca2+-binding RTX toxin-like protein